MSRELKEGDYVAASPVGPGYITGFSERGFPQVNHITVACLVLGDHTVFDPYENYKKNGLPPLVQLATQTAKIIQFKLPPTTGTCSGPTKST